MIANRRILIVDDNPDDIERLTRTLSDIASPHYQVNSVTNPQDSLALLKQDSYDCVIIDYHFPKTSGLEVLKSLRKEFEFLPIVILTGQTDEVHAAKLIKNGAQDYIAKSTINTEQLHSVISEAIIRADIDFRKSTSKTGTCNVLIIDDNPDDIEFCIRSLKRKSKRFRYQSASTGEEGLTLIETFAPDCIILDHSLPGTSGIDLLPQILNISPHLPVIIMTGQGNEMIAVEAIKRGAENYLVKSKLDGDILEQNINAAVEKKQLEHALSIKEKELQQKQKELLASYTFQDLIIESLPHLVFIKDSDFKLIKANKPFLDLYQDQDKVIGFTTVESYSEEEAEAFLAKDREAFEQGSSETTETILFPNGDLHTLITQKKRFQDANGENFILGVSRDITEREDMIKQLQKSNQDLEQFAYIASHDLKSPLNGIKKLVSWIEDDHGDALPQQAKEHFSLIKNRVDRMSRLLTDLLDYAKINSKLKSAEKIDFSELCHYLHSMIENCDLFELSAPAVEIQLPRVALQIVLLNLVGNAIKHHSKPKGNIMINISTCQGGYELSVADDGAGIPGQYKDKIFEMFQTLKTRDSIEGSGMGLAMVKKIIEHYGGYIQLDLDYTQGCRMNIFWPCRNNIYNKLSERKPL